MPIGENEFVLLISPKGKRYLRKLDPKDALHTNDGKLEMAVVAEAGFGAVVKTHMGRRYQILRPTIYDIVKNLRRQTQIIYPKDIGYILMRLGVGPGSTVVEAGSGSGSMTLSLAWSVGPTGRVHTYERREEFSKLNARNVRWAGLDDGRVVHAVRDVEEEGFDVQSADAVFLDMRTPWTCLDAAEKALAPGGPIGFLLPTTNQVCELLAALEGRAYAEVEVCEIMLRRHKPVAERFRPEDRMVAHTGYLIFARKFEPYVEQEPEEAQGLPAAQEAEISEADDSQE
jgi:tRNA (adenine57-N1/adenine58-N1)-methyltransferase